MAATLGGTQSLHTNSLDEAVALTLENNFDIQTARLDEPTSSHHEQQLPAF